MDAKIVFGIIALLIYALLCVLVTVAYIVVIVKIVKKVKQRAEEKRIAQIEEARRRKEEAEYRKKVEEEQRKAEEERRKAEEKAREEEEARQVKQWTETYKKSIYAQRLAKIFASDFINAISCITYDMHEKDVKVKIRRNAYYTILHERSNRKSFFEPVVDGLDFYRENLKSFDNEFQLQGFMEAVLEVAEDIVKREYVAKHPVDINGEKYKIWKGTGYPIKKWDNDDGGWDEDDRANGFGWWKYTYSVALLYSAPNPYYEPQKNLI